MPAQHPSVKDNLCNQTLNPGDSIPELAWGPYTKDRTCIEMSGAQLFYAFNYPVRHTGNPGYYGTNALSLYVIVDSSFSSFLVVTLDKPYTEVAGQSSQKWHAFMMDLQGIGLNGAAKIELMDDGNEQLNAEKKVLP